jgi:peptide/nickel transport system permease protein
MTAYIVRQLWQMIPTLLGVILLVFILFNWVGGDPAVLAGKISSAEQIRHSTSSASSAPISCSSESLSRF